MERVRTLVREKWELGVFCILLVLITHFLAGCGGGSSTDNNRNVQVGIRSLPDTLNGGRYFVTVINGVDGYHGVIDAFRDFIRVQGTRTTYTLSNKGLDSSGYEYTWTIQPTDTVDGVKVAVTGTHGSAQIMVVRQNSLTRYTVNGVTTDTIDSGNEDLLWLRLSAALDNLTPNIPSEMRWAVSRSTAAAANMAITCGSH